jgi:hypothetical protein
VIFGAGDIGTRAEGILHSLVLDLDTAGGTLSIYDNTAASGTPVFVLVQAANAPAFAAILDIRFRVGLTVRLQTFASPNLTIVMR